MEYVVVVVVIGGFVWLMLRGNTRRGVRTVRAHAFMTTLADGGSIEEANRAAAALDGDNLPKRAIHDTMVYLQAHHRGRQRDLLRAAEKAGWKD